MAPIHPSTLKPQATTVVTDRICHACGYNLRGLLNTARCPECGAVAAKPPDVYDPLALMPLDVIRRLRRGAILLTVSVAAWFAGIFGAFLGLGWLLLIAPAAWIVGVWWLTPALKVEAGRRRGFTEHGTLRRAARWLQLAWPVAIGLGITASMTTGWMSDVAEVAGKLFVVAGLGGLVALILMLQRLAEWTYDDFADKALNWALWGIPAGALLMGLIPLPGIIGLLLGLLWLTAFIALPVGVLSLSKSIVLSVEHAKEHLAREQRRRDRQDEYHDALAATAPRSDSTRG